MNNEAPSLPTTPKAKHHLRFHIGSHHLTSAFGSDGFGKKAESFARFFGTPTFIISQTVIVGAWIILNAAGVVRFDLYPFILLNLAFSLQAAYAAPLILLAQTRQADRDKANVESDALHREELARMGELSQAQANANLEILLDLMRKNTELTELTHTLSSRIADLSTEIRDHIRSNRT
ncbi:DUF1003 domain-containing protein [Akkermansiaceae bacterium]|nr:DUF1003 domain-containing protein [Akkermansiaceae bacterium]